MVQQMSFLGCALMCFAGCAGEVQLVERHANGGTLFLRGPSAPAAAEARILMAEHCGGRFLIKESSESAGFQPVNAMSGHGSMLYRCVGQASPTLLGSVRDPADQVIARGTRD